MYGLRRENATKRLRRALVSYSDVSVFFTVLCKSNIIDL